MEEPRAAFDRYLDALAHRDLDALRACIHPDFESVNFLHPGRSFQGRDRFLDAWARNWETMPGFHTAILRSVVDGDHVWFESRRLRGDGSVMAGGVNVVRVEDGQFRLSNTYIDSPGDDGESNETWAERQRQAGS